MPLPSSHKIVVIDDKPEEVASLIGTLSKNGIGVVYFTGQLEQLPLEPLSGIRIIFSDIDLVESKDNKTVSANPRINFKCSSVKAVPKGATA